MPGVTSWLFLLLFYVFVCVHVFVGVGALGGQKKILYVPPWATEGCEPPDMGVGNSDPLEKQNVFLIT